MKKRVKNIIRPVINLLTYLERKQINFKSEEKT